MASIAFYAPMKPPTDPVPSGDRTMARALMAALSGIGLGAVRLISELRSRDGMGDKARQDEIFRAAEAETERLVNEDPPALWLTWLIGVSRRRIPAGRRSTSSRREYRST